MPKSEKRAPHHAINAKRAGIIFSVKRHEHLLRARTGHRRVSARGALALAVAIETLARHLLRCVKAHAAERKAARCNSRDLLFAQHTDHTLRELGGGGIVLVGAGVLPEQAQTLLRSRARERLGLAVEPPRRKSAKKAQA